MQKLIPVLLVSAVLVVSCKRQDDLVTPASHTPTNINELRTSPNFSWNTSQKVTINVAPVPTQVVIKRLLLVKDLDGNRVYSAYFKMSDGYNATIEIPAHIKKVTAEYGAIVREVEITSGAMNIKLTPDIGNED